MSTRGFIKPVGGHMRMRFVQAGYDADNMATPANKVIFDSDDIGTLSIITTGEFRFLRDGASPVTRTVASWSNLGFVPLCTFQFMPYGATTWDPLYIPGGSSASLILPQRITVTATGITATLLTSTPNHVDIRYQVYRLVVV